jgi:hypothetical protein
MLASVYSLILPISIMNGMLLDFGHMSHFSPFFRALTQDEMWYAEEVSVSCAATTTVDAAGIAVYANGAKTLFLYSLGMAIYSWLF